MILFEINVPRVFLFSKFLNFPVALLLRHELDGMCGRFEKGFFSIFKLNFVRIYFFRYSNTFTENRPFSTKASIVQKSTAASNSTTSTFRIRHDRIIRF